MSSATNVQNEQLFGNRREYFNSSEIPLQQVEPFVYYSTNANLDVTNENL